MLRFTSKNLSPTLEYLKTCPRVMSDTLQSTKSGKNETDDTGYDLVMKHTAKVELHPLSSFIVVTLQT